MNLNQVEYFVKAAEHLSFSHAAEEMYVTQQAVSKAVATLEDELGTPLFTRLSTGLSLTPEGKRALELSRSLLADAQTLQTCAQPVEAGAPAKRTLRIAVADVMLGNFASLDDILAFEHGHPSVRLRVTEETSDRCLEMVAEGRADMGVVVGRGITHGLSSRMLIREEFVPFTASAHPLVGAAHVSVDDLARQHFLIPRGAEESADLVREALFDAGAAMPTRAHFAFPDCSARTLISLVCQGNDVGIIARRSAGLVAQLGGAVLPCDPGLIALPLSLVAREGAPARGIQADLAHHLREVFQQG